MAKRKICIRAQVSSLWLWVKIHNHLTWYWHEGLFHKGMKISFQNFSAFPCLWYCWYGSKASAMGWHHPQHQALNWPVPVPISMALPGHPVCRNNGAPLQLWSWPQSTGSHPCLGLIWSTSQGGNLCPELGGNNASAPQMPSTWLPSPVLRDPDCLFTPCPASQMHSLSCTKSRISATKRYSSEKYGAAEIMKRKRPVNGLSR